MLFSALPGVKVTPRIQSRRPGEKTSMFCHVIGEPFPEVNIIFQRVRVYGVLSLTTVYTFIGGLVEKRGTFKIGHGT